MGLKVYGIKNCDTVRKALKALEAAGKEVTFIDVRKDGLEKQTVSDWLSAMDAEVLINKRGTTWRNLSDAEKTSAENDPAATIAGTPTLFKRPIIVGEDGSVTAGWKQPEQDKHLG